MSWQSRYAPGHLSTSTGMASFEAHELCIAHLPTITMPHAPCRLPRPLGRQFIEELQQNVNVLHLRIMTLSDQLSEQQDTYAAERTVMAAEAANLRSHVNALQRELTTVTVQSPPAATCIDDKETVAPRYKDLSARALALRLQLAEAEADQLRRSKATLELQLAAQATAPAPAPDWAAREQQLREELAATKVRAVQGQQAAEALRHELASVTAGQHAYRRGVQRLHEVSMQRAANEITALHSTQHELMGEMHRSELAAASPRRTPVLLPGSPGTTAQLQRLRDVHAAKIRTLREFHRQLDDRLAEAGHGGIVAAASASADGRGTQARSIAPHGTGFESLGTTTAWQPSAGQVPGVSV